MLVGVTWKYDIFVGLYNNLFYAEYYFNNEMNNTSL